MHYNLIKIYITTILLLMCIQAIAQEHHSESFLHHKITLVISHTHVPAAGTGTQNSDIIVPSWGLDYEYWFNYQWAIGLHSDMEIAHYVIENEEQTEIERERPLILAMVGIFKPGHNLAFQTGFGREFETHEEFWVARLGIGYEIEIRDGWDISPELIYDIKESVYDSWTIGLAIGKRL